MNPADYDLTDEAVEAIEAEGAKLTPEPKRKGPRPTSLDPAKAALAAGEPIPYLTLGSAQNPAATKKGYALWGLYAGTDYDGLNAYVITGSNTYAKMLRGYKDILLASCAAGIEPPGDMINDVTAAYDAAQAAHEAEVKARREARKAEKPAKAPKAPKVDTATEEALKAYADVPSDELAQRAAELEAAWSTGRKDGSSDELQAERRAQAKAMRKALAGRLTPEDKAAGKALASKLRGGAKPEDMALIGRGQTEPVKSAPEPVAETATVETENGELTATTPKAPAKGKEKTTAIPADHPHPIFKSIMGARADARKELGDDVVEGLDYKIIGSGKKLSWVALPVAQG